MQRIPERVLVCYGLVKGCQEFVRFPTRSDMCARQMAGASPFSGRVRGARCSSGRHDNVRGPAREPGVFDFAIGSGPASERQDAARVVQHGLPVLLVPRIHPAAKDERVDLANDIEGTSQEFTQSSSSFGPSMNPSSDTCSAAMILRMAISSAR